MRSTFPAVIGLAMLIMMAATFRLPTFTTQLYTIKAHLSAPSEQK